jgi:FtsP/CotA-like multicopper oxidase with cupredoxin domain
MKKTAVRWFGRSLVIVTAALSSACADDASFAPVGARTIARGVAAVADVSDGNRLPDLAGCDQLAAPVGSTLVLHAFGIGVQIYHWNGTSWGAATPSATIYADAGGQGAVASHFAGPTWQSNSGGRVVGTVANRCTVDPASIQWLSLTAVPDGPGVFEKVTFIQRLNTVGGNAPSTDGTVVGQEARVPYTADYLFYKAP